MIATTFNSTPTLKSVEEVVAEAAKNRVVDAAMRVERDRKALQEIQDSIATMSESIGTIDWATAQALIDAREQAEAAVAEGETIVTYLHSEYEIANARIYRRP